MWANCAFCAISSAHYHWEGLPLSINVKRGVFFSLLEWAHTSLWAYALGAPGWRFVGSWAQFSGQTIGSGKLSLLALADNCDLPAEYTRIDIYCHVFVDLITPIKAVFYVKPVQSFLCIMGTFCRESAGNCWGFFVLQSFFGICPS